VCAARQRCQLRGGKINKLQREGAENEIAEFTRQNFADTMLQNRVQATISESTSFQVVKANFNFDPIC
jgi:hypothetical protein